MRAAQRHRIISVSLVVETVATTLIHALAIMFMSALFAWVIVNWMAGCGETFQTSQGVYERGECVMVPWAQ